MEVDHYTDHRLQMAETYVPREVTSFPALYSFESALEALLPRRLPPVLRCMDLTPRVCGSAYRSSGETKSPTFFGHRFGDTIEKGREAVDRFMLRGPIVAHDIQAYAWPFVWVSWGQGKQRIERVIFPDGRGRLHAFVGNPPE